MILPCYHAGKGANRGRFSGKSFPSGHPIYIRDPWIPKGPWDGNWRNLQVAKKGVLADLGSHVLDLIYHLLGRYKGSICL